MKKFLLIALGALMLTLFVGYAPANSHAASVKSSGPGSPIVFFEIYVSDVTQAKSFYGKLLGWQFVPTSNYSQMWQIIPPSGGTAGALIEHPGRVNNAYGTPLCTPTSQRFTTRVALALSLGAKIEVPIGVIKGVGSIALIRDLDNNIIGLISDEGA